MALSFIDQIIQALDDLDAEPSTIRSAQWPGQTPAAMINRRRHLEQCRRVKYQLSHGRPGLDWKLCGNKDCSESCCTKVGYAPPHILMDGEQNMDGVYVKDIWSEFAALMAITIWRSSWWGVGSVLIKMHAIESFAVSPPVRRAYLEFKLNCEHKKISILSEEGFKKTLLSVLPRFYFLLAKLDDPESARIIHYILKQPDPYGPRPEWVLEDWIMQFLLTAELWRRKENTDASQRRWTFESPKVVAELLVAVLHNFYNMDREHCFEVEECDDDDDGVGARYDVVWQRWMDVYSLPAEEGEADDDYHVEVAKKVKTIVALSIVGYASKFYFDFARERRIARAIAEDRDRQRRDQMMMDLYGDRSSLEDLERAVAEYSKK
ncbi:hypothetical protein PT974_01960 [Cladobotryum mycophilum]|uniref:Uncharacterized protein n=1 Tax=Cladobotryum mycophilum TaxID=491253 RepID=A0ABR0SWT5_9HYPO